jgi:hypothetical protein
MASLSRSVTATAVPASAQGIAGGWPQGGQGIAGGWGQGGQGIARCYWQNQPIYDGWGNVTGYRPIQVC